MVSTIVSSHKTPDAVVSLSPADYRQARIDSEGVLPAAVTYWPSIIERDRWVDLAVDLHQLTANQTAVLRRVCFRAGSESGCTESQGNMGKYLRLGRRTVQRCLDQLLNLGVVQLDGRKHSSLAGNAYIPNFLVAEKLGCATLGGQPESEEIDPENELGCATDDVRLRQSLTHKQKEQIYIPELTNLSEKNAAGESAPAASPKPDSEMNLELVSPSVPVAPVAQPSPAQAHADIPDCQRCGGPLMTLERLRKAKQLHLAINLTLPCKTCANAEMELLEAEGVVSGPDAAGWV